VHRRRAGGSRDVRGACGASLEADDPWLSVWVGVGGRKREGERSSVREGGCGRQGLGRASPEPQHSCRCSRSLAVHWATHGCAVEAREGPSPALTRFLFFSMWAAQQKGWLVRAHPPSSVSPERTLGTTTAQRSL